MSSARRLLLLALVAALVVPAVAAASLWIKPNGEGESNFKVKNGYMVPDAWKWIEAPSNFKCNTSNMAVQPKRIKLAGGKIDFDGKAYPDVGRAPKILGRLIWKGTVTRKNAKGTIRFISPVTPKFTRTGVKYVNKRCDTGVLHYTY